MASFSRLGDNIDSMYGRLLNAIDGHIERLVAIEAGLDEELRLTRLGMIPDVSFTDALILDDPGMASDSDDDSEDFSDGDNEVVQTLSQMAVQHVHFNDEVFHINPPTSPPSPVSSEGTVSNTYTPFNHYNDNWYSVDDYDYESDSDTIIPDWVDPSLSPPDQYVIHSSHILFGDY